MLVREVMTREPVTIPMGTTVQQALILLSEHEITALPVVKGDGRICGVVSEADLVRERLGLDPRAHEIPRADDEDEEPSDRAKYVDDVMTRHSITVRPDTDLADAVDLITSTAVKSVPVVDDHGRVRGILSRSDVVRLLAQPDRSLEAQVDAELTSIGLSDWLVEAHDGAIRLTGPEGSSEQTVARLVASRVRGVLDVRMA